MLRIELQYLKHGKATMQAVLPLLINHVDRNIYLFTIASRLFDLSRMDCVPGNTNSEISLTKISGKLHSVGGAARNMQLLQTTVA
jgi:hypothetical protein